MSVITLATPTRTNPEAVVQLVELPDALLATPARFIIWLLQHAPREIVGYRGIAWKCPLHHFLSPHYPDGTNLAVARQMLWVDAEHVPTPAWASNFIFDIDHRTFSGGCDAELCLGEPVTASECLELLGVI